MLLGEPHWALEALTFLESKSANATSQCNQPLFTLGCEEFHIFPRKITSIWVISSSLGGFRRRCAALAEDRSAIVVNQLEYRDLCSKICYISYTGD